MPHRYCDIIPNSDGWLFIVDGEPSPVYPSYVMAVHAARRYAQEHHRDDKHILLRRQDLQGTMQEI